MPAACHPGRRRGRARVNAYLQTFAPAVQTALEITPSPMLNGQAMTKPIVPNRGAGPGGRRDINPNIGRAGKSINFGKWRKRSYMTPQSAAVTSRRSTAVNRAALFLCSLILSTGSAFAQSDALERCNGPEVNR